MVQRIAYSVTVTISYVSSLMIKKEVCQGRDMDTVVHGFGLFTVEESGHGTPQRKI